MNLLDLFVKIGVQDEASSQIDQVSSDIVGKLAGAAKTAAKALAGMWATKKVYDFGKAAYDSYAKFEQLVGGIDKLYGDASAKMQGYAQQAYLTTGMSVNQYMESVTGFTSSLINSLGGDTNKAADIANMAMKDISDNANTFGKYTVDELTQVYQALAKGQYQTLDNLNLGFGGTKEGLQQLIDKANELRVANGEMGDLTIDSFSDIVQAIHLVQEEANIAGTTEREALKTLEGSANATKAAWQNLVTEFGKPDADIGARIADMMTAVLGKNGEGGLLRNATQEIRVIAGNMVKAVSDGVKAGVDWLFSNAGNLTANAVKALTDLLTKAFDAVRDFRFGGAFDLIQQLFPRDGGMAGRVSEVFGQVGEQMAAAAPEIVSKARGIWNNIAETARIYGPILMTRLGETMGQVMEWLSTAAQNVFEYLVSNGPQIVAAIAEAFYSVVEWLTANGPQIVSSIGEVFSSVVNYLVEHREEILTAIGETITGIATAIMEHGPEILGNIMTTVGEILGYLIGAAAEIIAGFVMSLYENREQIFTFFAELPGNILSALGDLGSLLVDAGSQLVAGLISGISGSIGGVVETLIGGLQDAVNSALSFLGIASPSKLFKWVGKMSMEGLAGGIESTADRAEKATSKAVQGVYGAASGTVEVSMAPSNNGDVLEALSGLRDSLNMSVYLDGKTLVGGIAPTMNTALGRL